MEYNEVKISRILNPTAINLGEFVINPYMGCEYSCLYCYVRSNRIVQKKKKAWGSYVDIRINAADCLEKELSKKKPRTVLLGSTTECFQPIEKQYHLTGRILEILNHHQIKYVILTRSPLILEYIKLLKKGYCSRIYFTFNDYTREFKDNLEPRSPDFKLREEAINNLLNEELPVIPYFSPILPWISNINNVFSKFPKGVKIDFECLNFNLINIKEIIEAISTVQINLKPLYNQMLHDQKFYGEVWNELKVKINQNAKAANKNIDIYTHKLGGYFDNKY